MWTESTERLIAFGCSITYGQSLEDNHPKNTAPSQHSWPQVLADIAGIEAVNKAQMGASCKEIINLILEFEFNSRDIVAVAWPYPERWCIIDEDNNVTKIGPWMWQNYKKRKQKYMHVQISKTANMYYEYIFDEYDSFLEQRRNIMLAKLYLDSIGIPSYHTTTILEKHQNKKWFDVPLLDIGIKSYTRNNPRALDGQHPGQSAHYEIANEFWNKINGLQSRHKELEHVGND